MGDRVVLCQGDACTFDPETLFGRMAFERVFISYALSMIPDWEAALWQAARCIADGGKLELVDFGQQEALPDLWKRAFFGWLARFHVTPRADMRHVLERMAADMNALPHSRSLYRDYAVRAGLMRA